MGIIFDLLLELPVGMACTSREILSSMHFDRNIYTKFAQSNQGKYWLGTSLHHHNELYDEFSL